MKRDKAAVPMPRSLEVCVALLGLVLGVMATVLVPLASADSCTVTATLLNGQTETFNVNAAPGTPPADMLPPGTPPVSSVTANCDTTSAPAGPASSAATSTKTRSGPPSSGSSGHAPRKTTPTESAPVATVTPENFAKPSPGTTPAAPTKARRPAHHTTAAPQANPSAVPAPAPSPARPRHRRRAVAAAHSKRSRHSHPRPAPGVVASPAAENAAPGPNLRPGSSSFPWLLVAILALVATGFATPVARWRSARISGGLDRAPDSAAANGGGLGTPASPAAFDAGAYAALGARLEQQGDLDGALDAYRGADAGGNGAGATNLGVLLERHGDLEGALAAYRRADERGDANGSFNLGCLLAERGDVDGAAAALRRADLRGDPAGASNLGVLLEQQGDLDGALAAYRRADQRGDTNGSFNLGLLLAASGDRPGAEEAYRRAAEGSDPEVVDRARSALAELGGYAAQAETLGASS